MQTHAPAKVRAPLNLTADRTDGGIWSSLMRHLITQALGGREVEIRDARRLTQPPSPETEGFVLRGARPLPPPISPTASGWRRTVPRSA